MHFDFSQSRETKTAANGSIAEGGPREPREPRAQKPRIIAGIDLARRARMLDIPDKAAVWFRQDDGTSIFYPFGVRGAGYLVPESLAGRISRWSYWRAQLTLILFTIGFVPLVDFWAPSHAGSRRLEAPWLALAVGVLAVIAFSCAFLGNRAAYALLLKDCPVLDRIPSRAEQKACTKQFGMSRRNIIFLPLPVAFLGVLVCATTMFFGAVREDIPMWALGALISPLFWYAFVKDLVDQAWRWARNSA